MSSASYPKPPFHRIRLQVVRSPERNAPGTVAVSLGQQKTDSFLIELLHLRASAGSPEADGPGAGASLWQGGEIRRALGGVGPRERGRAQLPAGRPGQKTDERPEREALPRVQRRGGRVQLGGRSWRQRQRADSRDAQAEEPGEDPGERQGTLQWNFQFGSVFLYISEHRSSF